MLNKNTYKPIYRTHKDSIDRDFYVPCFCDSISLYRAAGFFSLHSLTLSIDGLIRFAQKKGRINLICSPDLSQSDAELIDACISLGTEHISRSLLKSLTECKLSDEELDQLDVVCNMLTEGLLEIKIAYQHLGIFHEKFGIFVDEDGDKVYYNGSMNETRGGLVYNQESIRVNYSWQDDYTSKFINEEQKYFEALWNNQEETIEVIDFPTAVEKELLSCYKRSETLEAAIDSYISKHFETKKKELFPYQEKAINEFCYNGYHHFYEMATGTGKTFTSVKTITQLKKERDEKLFVVVCVPQIDLQSQWEFALREEGYDKLYLFGGNGTSYEKTIAEATISYYTGNEDVLCIAVYDTFFSKMYHEIRKIKPLFIIVDEAHNLTQGNLKSLIQLDPQYKLGLSATIQRFSSSESEAIVKYFTSGDTFHYGIEDAIAHNFLSKYEYHPIFVRLTEEENNKFQFKSKLLAQELNKKEEDQDKETIDRLRRERSLIVKRASEKLIKLRELAEGRYSFVNSVVYCGQGKDDEGEFIIDSVTRVLYENGFVVSQFTSRTPNRKRVLYEFEKGYFDTLVAIKCFDEGVDVPKLDKIYIMASDTAIRQTVQRRGRVLRKCKESGKTIAYIYDMVVLPPTEAGTYGSEGLLKIELSRAKEYNRLALNKDINESVFYDIEETYHMDHITNTEDHEYESEPD
ncbi:MAG: DEAD/DEAH box helicase family protein [Bacteroidales bacterium]|nr:DEAD/DEAH box helicase family protein [Bacteroidales bacterium]